MKKFVFALAAVAAIAFAGCSKEDDGGKDEGGKNDGVVETSLLVGTWEAYKATDSWVEDGQTYNEETPYGANTTHTATLTFTAETVVWVSGYYDEDTGEWEYSGEDETDPYSVTGDSLKIGGLTFTIKQLTSSDLVLYRDGVDPDGSPWTYTLYLKRSK